MTLESVEEILIQICTEKNPKVLKILLQHNSITTSFPTKSEFYNYFKDLFDAHIQQEANLHLQIRKKSKYVTEYNIYDDKHIHPRITLIATSIADKTQLDILPF